MNTFLKLSAITMSSLCIMSPLFAKYKVAVNREATQWCKDAVTSLQREEIELLVHFFALTSEEHNNDSLTEDEATTQTRNKLEEFVSCLQAIQENQQLISFIERYQEHTLEQLEGYEQYLRNKYEQMRLKTNKSAMTGTEEELLNDNIETKIRSLISYINGIYYSILSTLYAQFFFQQNNQQDIIEIIDEYTA